ncbi:hypothetical protein BKA62DRAFT_694933 [Auriculariales sp. MPI-PUGE-AT-0066]|nr:hypothetical protein BKA62DRAFT_694933 [Auriculariales sp. MPI-PUGE-AT-0066]
MSDDIKVKSAFLCSYMSNHQDTLVGYVAYFGKVKGAKFAKMESIDGGGMTLTYTLADKSTGSVRVSFDPPLLGYDEVRPRLTQMKYEAEEGLDMSKAPQIKTFRFPPRGLTAFGIVSSAALAHYRPEPFTEFLLNIANALPGGVFTFQLAWYAVAAAHVLEAMYAAFLCGKHHAGPELTLKWTFAVLLAGFPVLGALRAVIQKLRIDSIKPRD